MRENPPAFNDAGQQRPNPTNAPMELAHLLLSLAVVDFLAVASPGPNFLLVSQAATTVSRRHALFVVGGILTSNVTWCAAALLGLSAVFRAAPMLHAGAQTLGALYLVYLGVCLWRASGTRTLTAASTPPRQRFTEGSAFMRGWYVGMSNPKSLVYFSSVFTVFLPQGSSPMECSCCSSSC
jgi:threonine efflux protein